MKSRTFNLCVAACENLGIGKNGDLPWRLKNELRHFNRCTTRTQDPTKRNAVIMGRKTYFGIPANKRPLPGRLNIVLTGSSLEVPSGVILCKSLDEAMALLETNEEYKSDIENVWIAGGYSVYKEAMASDRCHRIYFTEIKGHFDCDAFFPEIDEKRFQKVPIDDEDIPSEVQKENGIEYQYFIYQRT